MADDDVHDGGLWPIMMKMVAMVVKNRRMTMAMMTSRTRRSNKVTIRMSERERSNWDRSWRMLVTAESHKHGDGDAE